jgi:hypothetical protein
MKRLFVALAVALSIGGLASAEQLIWDNGPPTATTGFSVIVEFDTAGAAGSFNTEVADDFILTAPMTVTRIAPQMFIGGTADLVVDYWIINIYSDAPGLPGTLLHSTTAPGATYLVTAPGDGILSLTLATPFAASASTRYWITLAAAFDQVQGRNIRWREIAHDLPGDVMGNVGYWRGNLATAGLIAADTWEPVGQKNGIATTGEMQFTLYGNPAGLCGDANCDGLVNNGDIDAFVMALTDLPNYLTTYGCTPNCDTNHDTFVNNGDIDSFVVAVLAGGCPEIP